MFLILSLFIFFISPSLRCPISFSFVIYLFIFFDLYPSISLFPSFLCLSLHLSLMPPLLLFLTSAMSPSIPLFFTLSSFNPLFCIFIYFYLYLHLSPSLFLSLPLSLPLSLHHYFSLLGHLIELIQRVE